MNEFITTIADIKAKQCNSYDIGRTEAARENAMRAEYLWNEDADNDPFAVRETADTEDLVKGTDFAETI